MEAIPLPPERHIDGQVELSEVLMLQVARQLEVYAP